MKYVTILLLLIVFFSTHCVYAQTVMKSKIVKAGYGGDFMPFQESNHRSIHLELENSTRWHYLTNEFGLGFLRNGGDLYYMKFDYKFYPFSAIFRNFKYQGIFISAGPGLYYSDLDNINNKIGVGLFTTGGIQLLMNNRISVSFEMEMDIIGNLTPQVNSFSDGKDHQVYFTNSLKIGYVFNVAKKNPKKPY